MDHQIIGGRFTLADGTPLPLSKVIRAGDFVDLSGQLGLNTDGQLAAGIESQTTRCLDNIEGLLAEADARMDQIIRATVWLTDMSNFGAFNAVYGARFGDSPPVRSTVCSGLALPGALIEIEVTAYAP